MNGVEPTYENISSFAYPGARPLYVYVKNAHLDAIPGLRAYLAEWGKMWSRGGPLADIGLVASPDDVMARNTQQHQRTDRERACHSWSRSHTYLERAPHLAVH